ncbi:MAG: hypothetical protein A2176_14540 [Spirochaetes bacterium RBG_13_51_14]|nr:MAG: hypothetical protein A2176_14540 [Spirochaetes bacterium RBG_13_51_14]
MVETGDGSYTLYLSEYDEHMHSLSGAYEEALLKHVYPSGIVLSKKKSLTVLDVGFGLGYNTLALIAELTRNDFKGRCAVYALERERFLTPVMDALVFHDMRDSIYSMLKSAYLHGTSQTDAVTVTVLHGDARESVRTLCNQAFDAVFFDPFSPSRNPELWSVEFFIELYRLMSNTGVLTTYSCAPQARMAMIEAGFIVGSGPSVGGKREGTLAAKTGVITPLAPGDMNALRNNAHSVPYRDSGLSGNRASILERRREEIRSIKATERLNKQQ